MQQIDCSNAKETMAKVNGKCCILLNTFYRKNEKNNLP